MTTAIEPSAEEIELKPCPFCGEHLVHSPDLSTRTSKIFVHPETAHYCVVEHVMISTAGGGHRVVAWNRRAEVVGEPAPQLSGNTGELPAPAVAVPEGWKLAPLLPTVEMQQAYYAAVDEGFVKGYVAALAAAPEPPATRSEEPFGYTTEGWIDTAKRKLGCGSFWIEPSGGPTEVALYRSPPATRHEAEIRNERIEIDERLFWFLSILAGMRGRTEVLDRPYEWLASFCDDRPSGSDTFNLAIERGFMTSYYDGDRDHGEAIITEAGRQFVENATAIRALKEPGDEH
ncbi:hypothetical protein [Kaistia sp. MMO-174]|uniref:hypothetical protein n=1 Tax=Kaistia sp. MMO-174 TaxID=3081256 RepID=UPI003018D135